MMQLITTPPDNDRSLTPPPLTKAKPFVKWAGGKGQLLPELYKLIPSQFNRYFEPFLGGGAMFFYMISKGMRFNAYLSDTNTELVAAYNTIRNNPKGVIERLQKYKDEYKAYPALSKEQEDYYYLLRDLYNSLVLSIKKNNYNTLQSVKGKDGKYEKMSHDSKEWQEYYKRLKDLYDNLFLSINKGQSSNDIEITALLITLNKTGYNGLYRQNKGKGEFTAPWGKYKNPTICDINALENVSKVLRYFRPILSAGDYMDVTENAQKGDFVYLDPPYDPKSASSNFSSYTKSGFGREDQVQLTGVFRKLADRGCFVLLSNSDTPFIRELYSGYNIKEVDTQRAINCKGSKRTSHKELIIFSNYLDNNGGGNGEEDYAQTKQESLDIFLECQLPPVKTGATMRLIN